MTVRGDAVSPSKGSIAVVGGGVAGVTAAYLLQRKARVTLFEANDRLGGHTNTVVIADGPDAGTPVDTGFIVFNDQTYPNFHEFLEQLGVVWRWSDMSFSYECVESGFTYAGTGLSGLFADRSNLIRPSFYRFLGEIVRFSRQALSDLRTGVFVDMSLGDYLERHRFRDPLCRHYLIPMSAAIWSASDLDVLNIPASMFIRFFAHHGLLSLRNRPRWQTVVGGSHSYLKAFARTFTGTIRLGARVVSVERRERGPVTVIVDGGERKEFDHVVLATHADEALSILDKPSELEREALRAWRYSKNRAVLHTGTGLLPSRRQAWASWNYRREPHRSGTAPVSVTYYMNRLQGLETENEYCVTLNSRQHIPDSAVIAEFVYEHPLASEASLRAMNLVKSMSGRNGVSFCGSYLGYGFHEDAVRSALAVARNFGIEFEGCT